MHGRWGTLSRASAYFPCFPACSTHVGSDSEHPELCERCAPVVRELGFSPPAKLEPVTP